MNRLFTKVSERELSWLAVGRDAAVRLLSINRASGGKPHRSIRQESLLIINNA
jgi:hypothetical protein